MKKGSYVPALNNLRTRAALRKSADRWFDPSGARPLLTLAGASYEYLEIAQRCRFCRCFKGSILANFIRCQDLRSVGRPYPDIQ